MSIRCGRLCVEGKGIKKRDIEVRSLDVVMLVDA